MPETKRNPCTGCAAYDNGKCKAFIKYHSSQISARKVGEQKVKKATTPASGKTVAQIAKRLGISKNEVRRRKVEGQL